MPLTPYPSIGLVHALSDTHRPVLAAWLHPYTSDDTASHRGHTRNEPVPTPQNLLGKWCYRPTPLNSRDGCHHVLAPIRWHLCRLFASPVESGQPPSQHSSIQRRTKLAVT